MAINLDNIRKQMGRVEDAYAGAELHSRPQSLSPAEIILNPNNIAAENDSEESIRQLANSIEAAGLIHPLTVNKVGEHQYMLLSGERRYKAITTHLHWDYIPCTVYESLDEDMVTLVTIQANMEAREYSVAQRLALYQQLDAALRSLKEKGKFKGGVGRGIAQILGVSEQQIGKYKKLCGALDNEQLHEVTNIDAAVQEVRKKEKTESDFQFLNPQSTDLPSDSVAECQCTTCTCTGCHEECYGHCQGCGNKTTDCNSYQTEGEKRRSDQQAASAEAAESSSERAATERALATITELMMLVRNSDISDKAKQHLYAAHEELVKYKSAAGFFKNEEE